LSLTTALQLIAVALAVGLVVSLAVALSRGKPDLALASGGAGGSDWSAGWDSVQVGLWLVAGCSWWIAAAGPVSWWFVPSDAGGRGDPDFVWSLLVMMVMVLAAAPLFILAAVLVLAGIGRVLADLRISAGLRWAVPLLCAFIWVLVVVGAFAWWGTGWVAPPTAVAGFLVIGFAFLAGVRAGAQRLWQPTLWVAAVWLTSLAIIAALGVVSPSDHWWSALWLATWSLTHLVVGVAAAATALRLAQARRSPPRASESGAVDAQVA